SMNFAEEPGKSPEWSRTLLRVRLVYSRILHNLVDQIRARIVRPVIGAATVVDGCSTRSDHRARGRQCRNDSPGWWGYDDRIAVIRSRGPYGSGCSADSSTSSK